MMNRRNYRKKILITIGAAIILIGFPVGSFFVLRKAAHTRSHRLAPEYSAATFDGQPFDTREIKERVLLAAFVPGECDEPCEGIFEAFRLIAEKYSGREEPVLLLHTIRPGNDSLDVSWHSLMENVYPGILYLLWMEREKFIEVTELGYVGKVLSRQGALVTDPKVVLISRDGYIKGYYPVESGEERERLFEVLEEEI